jgi:integrase
MKRVDKLTISRCRQIAEPGYYNDGGGLYLRVSKALTKSWVFRYRRAGQTHEMGLGAFHTHLLTEARKLAVEQRQLLWHGLDPLEERRKLQRTKHPLPISKSFQYCADQYIALREDGWRSDKHRKDWKHSLKTHVHPAIGGLPVTAIDDMHVLAVLEPIWKTIPETATRVRGRIENILDWATARKFRSGDNPARWKGHMELLLPAREKRQPKHFGTLHYKELAALFGELRGDDSVVAAALSFTLLTCARSKEVLGAVWGEISRGDRMWIVPPERMKRGREHRAPLSGEALAILDRMWAIRRSDDGHIFPGRHTGPLAKRAMLALLKKLRPGVAVTVHGCARAAFETWAAELSGFPQEVRDLALAHAVRDKVVEAYRRTDQLARRRQLAQLWADVCTIGVPDGDGNVVTLPDRARAR